LPSALLGAVAMLFAPAPVMTYAVGLPHPMWLPFSTLRL
jgi:hypothetical protein